MNPKRIRAVLLLLTAGLQNATGQKLTLHMAGNQVAEYDLTQLDSLVFSEVTSWGSGSESTPTSTGDAINVTNRSATLVGYAGSIRDNLSTGIRVGFIHCLTGTPGKNNGTQTDVSLGSIDSEGRYIATISNLLSDTTYYYRSFVYQSGLWFYGKVKSFTTESIQADFSTAEASDVTCFSAKVGGSVAVRSEYSTLRRGICYGTRISPTTADKTVETSSGSFSLQLRQLLGGTVYYYRPYAIIDGQTRYGLVRTFRTLDDNVVETGTIDEETLTVTSRLTISGGAYSTLALGVCYGENEQPTTADWTVQADEVDEDNAFTVTLYGPPAGTVYYRAYVLIDGVPHYGSVYSFEYTHGTHGTTAGHEWVDLGLPSGTLWATCNVGASKPEDYGDYFAWGETSPKTNYAWSTYKWMNAGQSSWSQINKYTYADGQTSACWYSNGNFVGDGKTELEVADDAATANWGSGWRMPTIAQMQELINSNYTTSVWTTVNGVNGRRITSRSNGNSIFLPAAGYRPGTSLDYAGYYGYYRSCSLRTSYSYSARYLSFGSGYINTDGDYHRDRGQSVRPVRVD